MKRITITIDVNTDRDLESIKSGLPKGMLI